MARKGREGPPPGVSGAGGRVQNGPRRHFSGLKSTGLGDRESTWGRGLGSTEESGTPWKLLAWNPGDERGTRCGSPSVALHQQRPGPLGARGKREFSGSLWGSVVRNGPGTQCHLNEPSSYFRSNRSHTTEVGSVGRGQVQAERAMCWALEMLGFERAARHLGDRAWHAVIPGLVGKRNITFLDTNLQDPGVWNKSPQM